MGEKKRDEPQADNVITFPRNDIGVADLTVISGEDQACAHRFGYEVDAKKRVVTCARCGEAVPAFDALWKIAHSPESQKKRIAFYGRQEKMSEAEAQRTEERLQGLKRLERNAKGRAWRALLKMPAAEVVLAYAVQTKAQKYGSAALDLLRKRVGEAVSELVAAGTGE